MKEFSILFIILNYPSIASQKIDELSKIEFASHKNENLKRSIISLILDGHEHEKLLEKIDEKYKSIIKEINENTSIQIITKAENKNAILSYLDELLIELMELKNLERIESLEKELINNLDESSYSELIKLKTQLNRE